MEEESRKIGWEEDDVISFSNKHLIKLSEMLETTKEAINYQNWGQNIRNKIGNRLNVNNNSNIPQGSTSNPNSKWFEDGVDCQIMRAHDAKGWRKGKIRVKLNIEIELWEDNEESQSPLDNFRENQS